MKSNKDITDLPSVIRNKWKPSEGINWDLIQRMRFMNADAEIDPEDTYSEEAKKDIDE
jgi:hypothetical protein